MKYRNTIVEIFKYFTRRENSSQLIPLFLISGVFLFLPISLFEKIGIITWIELIKLIALVTFIFTSFYILHWIVKSVNKKCKDRRLKKKYDEKINEIVSDNDGNKVLRTLYREHPAPARLDVSNQKVRLLIEYKLIVLATDPRPMETSTYQSGKHRQGISMNFSLTELGENKIKEKSKD